MKSERRGGIHAERDPDMVGAQAAMRRAAHRARQRADRERAGRRNATKGEEVSWSADGQRRTIPTRAARPSRCELLAEADRIRAMTPGQLTDSVELLRADRDSR